MKAFDQVSFLAETSKRLQKPLMLLSCDAAAVDTFGAEFEERFDMLSGDTLDELRMSGVVLVEFDSAAEASNIHKLATLASQSFPNVELYAHFAFPDGGCLGISQARTALFDFRAQLLAS